MKRLMIKISVDSQQDIISTLRLPLPVSLETMQCWFQPCNHPQPLTSALSSGTACMVQRQELSICTLRMETSQEALFGQSKVNFIFFFHTTFSISSCKFVYLNHIVTILWYFRIYWLSVTKKLLKHEIWQYFMYQKIH